jgi:hypothetical protein
MNHAHASTATIAMSALANRTRGLSMVSDELVAPA